MIPTFRWIVSKLMWFHPFIGQISHICWPKATWNFCFCVIPRVVRVCSCFALCFQCIAWVIHEIIMIGTREHTDICSIVKVTKLAILRLIEYWECSHWKIVIDKILISKTVIEKIVIERHILFRNCVVLWYTCQKMYFYPFRSIFMMLRDRVSMKPKNYEIIFTTTLNICT